MGRGRNLVWTSAHAISVQGDTEYSGTKDTARTMEYTRQYPRREFHDDLGIPVTIIQFGMLQRQDITVRGVDISEGGLGVVSETPVAPGFIWFWRQVGNQKGGMVVWCKKEEGHYRAGIKFLPIPLTPGDYLKST